MLLSSRRRVFYPRSRAALVFAGAFEAVEHFYAAYDSANRVGMGEAWRERESDELRGKYKLIRTEVYERLDRFLEEVAQGLIRPSWNPRRYASVTHTKR
jgi:hypothetical protein